MQISFTGTRQGMTPSQKMAFSDLINKIQEMTFVHGDCVGADADAHILVLDQGKKNIKKRPSFYENQRAFSVGGEVVAPPEHPLDRNKKIVDDGEKLVACPGGYTEERRSGTWATIRYARKKNKKILIIWPDGTMTSNKEFDGSDSVMEWLNDEC